MFHRELAGKRKSEFEYIYDDKNCLVQTFDSENNLITKIEYDTFGRTSHIRRSDRVSSDFTFNNEINVIAKAILKLFGIGKTINNTFGILNMLEKSEFICNGVSSERNYIYDKLGRVDETESLVGTNGVKHKISYVAVDLPNSTTSLVDSIEATNTGATLYKKFSYTYDGLGNITVIKENDVTKAEYFYDDLNRLEKEHNAYLGETVKYEYDLGGNISKKYFYEYKDEVTLKKTVTYNYNDDNWKDKLSSYEVKYEQGFVPQDTEAYTKHTIIHDGIGNPTDYKNGWKFEWTGGKRLDKMSNKGYNVNIQCKYDEGDVRTQKIVNGTITNFITSGIKLLAQKTGSDTIVWQIDANGAVVGFTHIYHDSNGDEQTDTYFYIKNAQGDIVGITNESGELKAVYTYDSWGKSISIKDENGVDITDQNHIAHKNPLRYRSYYYDSETKLYYLNARYYDPETGRFINSDDNLEGGLNLFAYCANNPVNCSDPSGHRLVVQETQAITEEFTRILVALTGYNISIHPETGEVALGSAINAGYGASAALVRELIENPHTVVLRYTYDIRGNRAQPVNQTAAQNGTGYDATVFFNPSINPPIPTLIDGKLVSQISPDYIILGHELIHALAMAKGNSYGNKESVASYRDFLFAVVNKPTLIEELYTVGFPGYASGNRMVTENVLRAEHGLPIRGRYS